MEVTTPEKTKRNIALNVRRLMAEKGITQLALAAAIGEHQSFISRVCNGTNLPGIDVMINIAEVLETTVEILAKDPPRGKLARAS